MSMEQASAFLDKVEQDPELKNKLTSLGKGAKMEDVLDVAASSGYNISKEDLVAAGKTRAEQALSNMGELSDSELEQVAGGVAAGAAAAATITVKITTDSVIITLYTD